MSDRLTTKMHLSRLGSPVIFSLAALAAAATSHAQGALTPPGAPGPVMKSLDQIEPRTIVNATNTPGNATNTYVISLPGSYYLTSNLVGDAGKHGISIQADDVTLDLNGFALVGIVPATGTVRGIDVPAAQKNFCIRNGTVRGWNGGGVRAEAVTGALIEKVRALENTGAPGIFVGLGGLVRDCVATANGTGFQSGDRAEFLGCIATINVQSGSHVGSGFQVGDYVSIADCTASRNDGDGFSLGSICSILRCSATRNVGNGIVASAGCTIGDCTAGWNVGNGIYAYDSTVARCTANGNTGGLSGIENAGGTVSDCTAIQNKGHGIGALNVTTCSAKENQFTGIIANTASGCTAISNGNDGISATIVSNSEASSNGFDGIHAHAGSVTHCTAFSNGYDGIDASFDGVVAFCVARSNNTSDTGSVDIRATNAKRMLNDPSP